VYTEPSDIITTDTGKNFTSNEFKNEAKALSINIKKVPVKAHNSISKIERYHTPLRHAYDILRSELPHSSPELCLSLTVKAINNTADPNDLILTLLIFETYLRISTASLPSPDIIIRAAVIRKAMKKLNDMRVKRQIRDALLIRNESDTIQTL